MIELGKLRIPASRKTALSLQFGALCYRRRNGKTQFLLITGRRSGKWGIPKGWPVDGATPAQAARKEAYEEAGVKGRITGDCLGIYMHHRAARKDRLPTVVALFPLKVGKMHDTYPEHGQRKRKWFGRRAAASRVRSSELAQMIGKFERHPPKTNSS